MDECNHLVLSSVLAPVYCTSSKSSSDLVGKPFSSGDSTIQYIFQSVEEIFKSIVLSIPVFSLTSSVRTSLKQFSQPHTLYSMPELNSFAYINLAECYVS
ncbi:hypothetical protein NPIL_587511 [Nephila pilipes]|uniref:Uncharacterized protein n=1 Tax=Nephila pilipes TaxID=299642 RepID=A0A8X6IF81_NEPPI|nr:hypothetical protein NPIL_587511 [Nephila pilipes]